MYIVNRPNAESTKIGHNFRKQIVWKLELEKNISNKK